MNSYNNSTKHASSKKSLTKDLLEVKDLHAGIADKEILKGVSLKIRAGEVHVLMGPNGSGKSTLSNLLAGHPNYKYISGKVLFEGKNLLKLSPDARAKLGVFLAFQYPIEVAGVGLFNFLKTASASLGKSIEFQQFSSSVKGVMHELKMDPTFLSRSLNEGFSGGEKKKAEILQMSIIKPKLAILDETDSGLDIDSLRIVSEGVNNYKKTASYPVSILLVTHYFRILRYIKADFVHVLIDGKIVKSGGMELATKLEENGYDWISREHKS